MEGKASSSDLPPGFRFHPTDEELIVYYLRNQAMSRPCPVSIIPEVDIYKFDPWQLPDKALFGENEWYFFSPRDRKYPNGVRPNRAAVSGYWKATGTDKAIHSGSDYVGVKKALVFYKGRPPKGVKTDWIMHEYRLNNPRKLPNPHKATMRLDDWVLCRIYKKRNMAKDLLEQKVEDFQPAQMDDLVTFGNDASEQHISKFPRICSISHLLDMEYLSQQLLYDNNSSDATFDFHHTVGNAGIDDVENPKLGEIPYQYPYMDSGKTQVNQDSSFSQPIVVNPVYDMHGFDC